MFFPFFWSCVRRETLYENSCLVTTSLGCNNRNKYWFFFAMTVRTHPSLLRELRVCFSCTPLLKLYGLLLHSLRLSLTCKWVRRFQNVLESVNKRLKFCVYGWIVNIILVELRSLPPSFIKVRETLDSYLLSFTEGVLWVSHFSFHLYLADWNIGTEVDLE